MSDIDSGAPAPQAVAAPSAVPMNVSSAIRLLAGVVAGVLVQTGRFNPSDANTLAGIGIAICTALWILYKNTNAVRTLTAWMNSPEVTVVEKNMTARLPAVAPALLLALAMAPLMGGCAPLASLAGKVATNSPINPPAQVQVDLAAGDYAFDVGYNGLAHLYIANLPTLNRPGNATLKANAKAILAQLLTCSSSPTPGARPVCRGLIATLDAAAAAGDQATLSAQVPQVEYLICQATQLIAPTGQACKAPA